MSRTTKSCAISKPPPIYRICPECCGRTDKPARDDRSSKSGQVSYAKKPDGNDQDNKTARFPTRVNLRKMIRAAKVRRFPALLNVTMEPSVVIGFRLAGLAPLIGI
jgi:hypothetical protein